MLVTERMQALGGHARSSRQPPLKERKSAKADESAAKQDAIDETILENVATHDSAVAVVVDDVTPQTVVEAKPAPVDDRATSVEAVQDDDTSAAKRAIIHEWENWSALHSDELGDAKVAEYFFRHLQQKKTHLLSFGLRNEWDIVQALITLPPAIQS